MGEASTNKENFAVTKLSLEATFSQMEVSGVCKMHTQIKFPSSKYYIYYIFLGCKILSHILNHDSVGFEGFFEGQWLRARLCCHKISDSIFWLYYFTPH